MKQEKVNESKGKPRRILSFAVVIAALAVLFLMAVNTGSLSVGLGRLLRGLFVSYDQTVATIYDLRFPRIFIAMLAGAALAVSGVLFQAVLKNPLADPGIIGITSGASFVAVVVSTFLPMLYFFTPLIACCGGAMAFLLVYTLSWKGGLSPIRIILVGVAIEAVFSGLSSALNSAGGLSAVSSIVSANISQKTWSDVQTLAVCALPMLIVSLSTVRSCNLLALEDKTARGLGINVTRNRILVSVVAVLLASCTTAVAGAVSFLGLIVPHIGRMLVGHDHKALLPFSAILGAALYLLADTLGRTVAYPNEISGAVIMTVIGGPFFILLLRRSKTYGG